MENTFRDAVLWILIYMINWIAIESKILTFMVEKGQQRLNRVQALSYSYLDLEILFFIHSNVICLIFIGYLTKTSEVNFEKFT